MFISSVVDLKMKMAIFLSRFVITMEAVHVLWVLLGLTVRQLMEDLEV